MKYINTVIYNKDFIEIRYKIQLEIQHTDTEIPTLLERLQENCYTTVLYPQLSLRLFCDVSVSSHGLAEVPPHSDPLSSSSSFTSSVDKQ